MRKTQHREQRVGVFADVQNLYYSAKNLYNMKTNFQEILKEAVAGRKLVRALAYVIKADVRDEHNFHDALNNIGFEVKSKDLQTFYGGAKKGDWDVGIAMDIMRLANKLDVIVLISGDGDFKDLLEHVKALGCTAEVIAFGRTCSSRLKDEADVFIDIDNKKYLIPIKPVRNNGRPEGKPGENQDNQANGGRQDITNNKPAENRGNHQNIPKLNTAKKVDIPLPKENEQKTAVKEKKEAKKPERKHSGGKKNG